MKPFEHVTELPFAGALRPFDGELGYDGSYDTFLFDGLTLEDVEAPHSHLMECALLRTGRWRAGGCAAPASPTCGCGRRVWSARR